jgi:hypothetical protein
MSAEEALAQDKVDGESDDTWKSADFVSFGNDRDDENAPEEEEKRDENSLAQGAEPLPPWMESYPNRNTRRVDPLVALHNEIVDFCMLMSPLPEEIREREVLIYRFKKLALATFGADTVRSIVLQQSMCSKQSVDFKLVVMRCSAQWQCLDRKRPDCSFRLRI